MYKSFPPLPPPNWPWLFLPFLLITLFHLRGPFNTHLPHPLILLTYINYTLFWNSNRYQNDVTM